MSLANDEILKALGPSRTIRRAAGILMVKHNVSEDVALDMLSRGSSSSHQTVREIVGRIVAESRGDAHAADGS